MNHALGKEIFTKKEYLSELKRQGLEPARPVKREPPKPYKLDRYAIEMINHAKILEKSGRKPDGRMMDALHRLGVVGAPKDLNPSKGGFK
jgi:hypothetical protein